MHQYAGAPADGVAVHLERVDAVLELVLDRRRGARSFPGLRARMKPASAAIATAPPSTNPRASAETTNSTSRARAYSASAPTVARSAVRSRNSGVMSLKTILA